MSDEDFEKVDNNLEIDNNNIQPSSDGLKTGDKVAPGKVIGQNGKVERSKGREIVEGVQSAAEVGAAVASAGASSAAAAEGSATAGAAKASKTSALTKSKESNLIKGKLKGKSQGFIDTAKDKAADKIDEKAAKNPLFKKAVDEAADKAKVLNSGVGAAKSLLSGDFQGVKDNAKDFVKSIAKEKLKKIKMILAGLALAAFAIIIIVEFFIATLSDAWQNFDSETRKIANNVEKLTNLYRGFGYEDSKSAFYTEMNELDKLYDYKLDEALLLSTVFYSESMGFNTDYNEHLEVINDDPVNEVLSGDIEGLIKYLVQWEKDVLKDSQNTYDENGLVYNAQKIYRLRRLSAAMCSRSGTPTKISLSEFLNKYEILLGTTMLNLFKDCVGIGMDAIFRNMRAMFGILGLAYDVVTDSFQTDADRLLEIGSSLKNLLSIVSFGLCTITSVSLSKGDDGIGIYVEYIPYEFDKEKYDEYVKNYYFEDTPDLKARLPKNTDLRASKKDEMLEDIYRNKNLFKEIFLKYEEESSEEYADACIGAIDNSLVSNLSLPIDTEQTISFSGSESFGIVNGKRHNGVSLTSSNSGIKKGDNVYSIADGVVVDIGEDSQSTDSDVSESTDATEVTNQTTGKWVKIKHEDILINETEYTFYSVYKNLDSSSVKKDDSISKGDVIGTIGTSSEGIDQLYFEFRNESDSPIDPTNLFITCVNTGGQLVGDTNEIKIANYLLGLGYNYIQVSAALANIYFESGYSESALNSSSGASGICQWLGGRKTGLLNYTSSKNSQWQDLALQLDYLRAELSNDGDAAPYAAKNYYTKIMPAIEGYDANEATKYYCNKFEVPCKEPPCSECTRRANEGKGQEWYEYLQSNIVASGSSTGGSSNSNANGDGYPDGTFTSSNGITYKQYKQGSGSYSTQKYSQGTISSSGCGPTSVAILASGLINGSITPSRTASDMSKMCVSSTICTGASNLSQEMKNLGMSDVQQIYNESVNDITSALRSGKVMVISVGSGTGFTSFSHIMAVVDINSTGQVYVINPSSSKPTGWYYPSELTKDSNYIITATARKIAN